MGNLCAHLIATPPPARMAAPAPGSGSVWRCAILGTHTIPAQSVAAPKRPTRRDQFGRSATPSRERTSGVDAFSDEKLLAHVGDGDAAALEALYDRYQS